MTTKYVLPAPAAMVDVRKGTIHWTEDDGPGTTTEHIRYQPEEPVATPWIMGRFETPNAAGPRNNHNYAFGWNLSPQGGPFVANETAMGMAFEQYWTPDGGLSSYMEWHLLFVTSTGAQRRPYSSMFNRGTGDMTNIVTGEQFVYCQNAGGLQTFVATPNAVTFGRYGQLAVVVRNEGNDVPFLQQSGSAGYVELLRLNAADEVVLAHGGGVTKVGGQLKVAGLSDGGFVKAAATTGQLGVVTKPTITGSRADNTALANLLTALEAMGLIVDDTTESGNG